MARFRKGQQPGPGRPPGCRNKSSVILDAIGREGIENTIRMVKRKADVQVSSHLCEQRMKHLDFPFHYFFAGSPD